jgi:hypothetical protein
MTGSGFSIRVIFMNHPIYSLWFCQEQHRPNMANLKTIANSSSILVVVVVVACQLSIGNILKQAMKRIFSAPIFESLLGASTAAVATWLLSSVRYISTCYVIDLQGVSAKLSFGSMQLFANLRPIIFHNTLVRAPPLVALIFFIL